MEPMNFLMSACAALRTKSKSVRRSRARHRGLRFEAMEPRMPLSATALMLTGTEAELEPALIDAAIVQEPLAADMGDVVQLGTLGTQTPMVCEPVAAAELTSNQTHDDEPIDVLAVEAVMELESEASNAEEDTHDDFEQYSSFAMLGGPSPPSFGSPIVADPIVVDTPEILWFEISYGMSGIWHFEGEVEYKFPGDLTIVFGGYLEGHSVAVDSGGLFLLSLDLPSDASGMVTAQAFTSEGIESNLAIDWII